jgi:transcriptional antiterminator NusG
MSNWYIVHAYSGFENKVAQSIREEAAKKGLSEQFEDIIVPSEEVIEVKRGKKVPANRNIFPGYVLVKMNLNDHTWSLVRRIPRVSGFLGGKDKPQPVPQAQIEKIFAQIKEGLDKQGATLSFDAGESVKVIDGPFESFVGTVEEVDSEKQRLKVSVSIFGRPTPVELDFAQVVKLD